MSTFGDFTSDDAFDTATPEPEALARIILSDERILSNDPSRPATLEELSPAEKALRIFVAARLIQRLRDEGVI